MNDDAMQGKFTTRKISLLFERLFALIRLKTRRLYDAESKCAKKMLFSSFPFSHKSRHAEHLAVLLCWI